MRRSRVECCLLNAACNVGPAFFSGDEIRQLQFENGKLKEELEQLRTHIKESYVDKAELEAARQEERIKAQATLAPTLDQVNSFLKVTLLYLHPHRMRICVLTFVVLAWLQSQGIEGEEMPY